MEFMNCLNKDAKQKTDILCIGGRVVVIATGSNLLDTKYKLYGFNDDLSDH